MIETPSFLEDHISQIPALQLLQNLGYDYLRPQEVFLERKGKLSNLLLEDVLEKQLRRLNRIRFKGNEHEFSDTNIRAAVQALKDVPFDGLVRTSEKVYDLLSLGKAMEQTIEGPPSETPGEPAGEDARAIITDTKSFTLNFIDWRNPMNNVFHVAEKLEVEQ